MKMAVTGHRPNKIYGYDLSNQKWVSLKELFKTILKQYECEEAVIGMALGVDMVMGLAVIELKEEGYPIKLRCAVPCSTQSSIWRDPSSRVLYYSILEKSDAIVGMYYNENTHKLEYVPLLLIDKTLVRADTIISPEIHNNMRSEISKHQIYTQEYKPYLMQARNKYMVDYVDILIGVWNGSRGGTANCIEYADKIGKPVLIIYPE